MATNTSIACSFISLPWSSRLSSEVMKKFVSEYKGNEDDVFINAFYNKGGNQVLEVGNYIKGTCEAHTYNTTLGADCSLEITKVKQSTACLHELELE